MNGQFTRRGINFRYQPQDSPSTFSATAAVCSCNMPLEAVAVRFTPVHRVLHCRALLVGCTEVVALPRPHRSSGRAQ